MDESWKMRMGTNLPRRRSMETTSTSRHSLECQDFSDVFGGPPRSVMSRKFSGDFSSTYSSFYEEIFRPPEFVSSSNSSAGRSLPAFRIPARGEWFYSDVFGGDDDGGRRSRDRSRPCSKSKSKSNSSSVLSSEELSPHRRDDVAFNSFASKLRPINVPCKWNSSTMKPEEVPQRKQKMTSFPYSAAENAPVDAEWNDNFRGSYYRFSRQVSSPETISIEPNSNRSVKVSVDDLELNSPSSPASSLCEEPLPEAKSSGMQFNVVEEEEIEQEEDEVMSSYVIEINSDHREGNGEAVSIDEAIAWAKEKYHSAEASERASSQELTQQSDEHGRTPSTPGELEKWKPEIVKKSQKEIEMEMMDEDIKLWSSGKETNIRFLLSTLHHILWPNSGWHAIPITNLIDSSHVKKAYQKARLCIHPDKLQQRGASQSQKYVAEKAFSILQDAWAAFITQDVLF